MVERVGGMDSEKGFPGGRGVVAGRWSLKRFYFLWKFNYLDRFLNIQDFSLLYWGSSET